MLPTRYIVATVAALAIIACGAFYAWYDHDVVTRFAREDLRRQQEAGELSPEELAEQTELLDSGSFGVEVPSAVLRRQNLAYFLAARWFLWGPAVVAICLGCAALAGIFTPRA
ncbi:MAG TPA: hypothetical protein VMF30_16160 [Pirellulales bacterium]|nr:hypothetical protein [Pirellulales bacterium]